MRDIENLVFKGGGVLGTAYAGAIEALDEYGLLNKVLRVGGTSSGSITAALVALRFTSSEIKQITHAIPFKDFGDQWDPLRILTKYGLYKGDAFMAWMKNIINEKTGIPGITFAQWAESGFLELKVFATDLNTASIKEFSSQTTPDVVVAESIRASMAVPFFFSAWKFPGGKPDDHVYVDGGAVYSYPITCFNDLPKTLGFFLYEDAPTVSDLGFDDILKYSHALFTAMTNAQDEDFGRDKEEEAVTVRINGLGISSLDLKITDEERMRLFVEGKRATINYLAAQH
ncbi:MAG: patatin-like phospholipase family protein [Cyclobacteriaceae bacterium]|nr:patatin-like phospholipase family protein [Cyclobacteriaceae bacterium]